MSEASNINQADWDVCKSMQNEEWEVLEAIYPECVSGDISNGLVKLEISIELGDPRIVTVVDDGTVTESMPSDIPGGHIVAPVPITSPRNSSLSLSSLPPLIFQLILPPNYPLHAPPEIVALRATHSWLPQHLDLQRILLRMWQAGEGVLYNWVELIRTGEFLKLMDLEQGNAIRIAHPVPQLLTPLLSSHDRSILSQQFSGNTYTCTVCLESHKGNRCLQLNCDHIFCRACLENFWKLCIQEGDVGRVGCPDPECVKAGREATEDEVARVATADEVLRWKWLRAKRTLERDPSVIHCPLSFCQAPVSKPKSEDDESGWSRLRICQACGYSFCAFCRRTWHGPISDCPLSTTEGFVTEYISQETNSPKRLLIERRYGKANVLRLVAKYEEEKSNAEWFKSSTMACPGCQVHVQKSVGCNHMTCAKCRQHFCYRCGVRIDGSNPYKHFNTPGLSCWSKLFDFPNGSDDEWQPIEGFDAL